jgi:hypothetical protein
MIVLGVDPGSRFTGWCLYDSERRRALHAGQYEERLSLRLLDICAKLAPRPDGVVIERPRGHGLSQVQVVETGIEFGWLMAKLSVLDSEGGTPFWIYRNDVRKRLQAAMHSEFRVRDDKTAWQALCLLHGEGSDYKGRTKRGVLVDQPGAIGVCAGHARAALAVAVAFHLPA